MVLAEKMIMLSKNKNKLHEEKTPGIFGGGNKPLTTSTAT
jgi:hypothetical protein